MHHDLNAGNVNVALDEYLVSIAEIGTTIDGMRGIELFTSLKRNVIGSGPYSHVSLFEAANRIMTDLVILYGVRWLLQDATLPFKQYTVEYGHEDKNLHDITALADELTCYGEAFNVAPSFFQTKKASALKKLRRDISNSDYTLLLVNSDAVSPGYTPRIEPKEYIVFVDIVAKSAYFATHPKRR